MIMIIIVLVILTFWIDEVTAISQVKFGSCKYKRPIIMGVIKQAVLPILLLFV